MYPQFQNNRQIRVITHNTKLKEIKNLFGELKVEGLQLEMTTKALKPVCELSKKNLKKLKR